MKEFGKTETIYENVDALDPSTDTYKPNDLPERQEELDQLHQALKPVTMDGTPRNVLVYGPTGQGKTVGIDLKTAQLKHYAEENDIDLTVVHVSCEGANGSYQVLADTVKTLREIKSGPGEDTPAGYPRKVLFNMLVDELQEVGGTVILVLDELDAIGDDDYILYELSRASIEGIRLGLIGITNDLNFRKNLGEDVRSSLGKREVHFNSYDANQLRDILARRAVNALKDTYFDGQEAHEALQSDVLDPAAISLCAAYAAKETGDARHALELLSHACDFADDEEDSTVQEAHVERAHEFLEKQALSEGIVSAPTQRQIALLNVVERTIEGEPWIETATLYATYERATSEHDLECLAYRTYEDKLGDLQGSGLLEKKHYGRGPSEGTTNKWKLAIDLNTPISELEGAHSTLQSYIDQIKSKM
ncbi:Cdc6/Cdc18 family protein [Haloprofundus halobius]|uniref:Cdc6/Cdc18 family protein n=1 Tax=Haloprofundus halobius TaxID=2876194 RepID=UPI001CCB6B18|nr:AAA family ATPase [Haloprofundus halobius]